MPEIVFPRRIIYNEPIDNVLTDIASMYHVRNLFIITDSVIRNLDFMENLLMTLSQSGIKYAVYDAVPPEPPVSIADQIAEEARKQGRIDAFIAIGGGSVIDAAKAGLVKFVKPSMDIRDLSPFETIGLELNKPFLVAVPTTSGTGSEATLGVVLTDDTPEGRVKIALGSPEVIPFTVILDPHTTLTMPKSLRASTGVDALAHAIEAYVSNQSNPLTDALSEKSVVLIMENLEKSLENMEEPVAKMHLAADMAGMAFSNSGLGLAHAIAHPLGGMLGLHHGLTVGVVLPYVVEYNSEKDPYIREKYSKLVSIVNLFLGTRYASLEDAITDLYKRIGQPLRFRDVGIPLESYEKAKEEVSRLALQDADIAFAPIVPMPDEILSLLEKMY
ncbi:MAG: iron-containing alcohol dehydrogenase [Desulfurococcales archaeon]|nr:iron-containing alcohol dehydrogenase [Desulfurococcales archaeon]